ncbi:MAG TPA: metallophosphoesterase family protein [Chloroflexota bacterium]|nr:metallophosphoesterase family protein [Chloroflexota bacterium]
MRVIVIADIHANLIALDSVLADAGAFDVIWCLGDLVGYGPDPNECVERICGMSHLCIPGNHDYAAIGLISVADFNAEARRAAEWTGSALTEDSRSFLQDLPLTLTEGDFTLAHGSPRSPIWEYVLTVEQAQANLSAFSTDYCLIGHSHVPLLFGGPADAGPPPRPWPAPTDPVTLTGRRWLINPGSVGQPRDGDPRAAYLEIDTESASIMFRRVEYDVIETQRRIRKCGLPESLAVRLQFGR